MGKILLWFISQEKKSVSGPISILRSTFPNFQVFPKARNKIPFFYIENGLREEIYVNYKLVKANKRVGNGIKAF